MRTSPTLRRRRLAAELRQLRTETGLTAEQVANELGISKSSLSRIENAVVTVLPPVAGALLKLYGVEEDDVGPLLQIAKDARKRGWWQRYSDAIPDWFDTYVGLESEASEVWEFQLGLIPGLLQTADYARAVTHAENPDMTRGEVDRWVELRMQRQAREDPPNLWIVLDEAVLKRVVGEPKAMRAQLERLREAAETPGHDVQVLPFSAGEHSSMGSPFILLRFANPADAPLVYIETRAGSLYLEEPDEVRQYTMLYNHLRATAADTRRSVSMISEAIAEL